MEVVNIRQFNVVGDGIHDDTDAIQEAIIFCAKKKYLLQFDGATYCCGTVRLLKNTTIDFNNTTIKCLGPHLFYNFLNDSDSTSYRGNGNISIKNLNVSGGTVACLMHGKNISFDNINAKNTMTNHFFELSACKNVEIKNSTFRGSLIDATDPNQMEMIHLALCQYEDSPWLDPHSKTYDGTMNQQILIKNCLFDRSTDPEFGAMYIAIGNHSASRHYHKKIMVLNCIMKQASVASIHARNWNVVKVVENQFLNSKNEQFENCKRVKRANNQVD